MGEKEKEVIDREIHEQHNGEDVEDKYEGGS